MTSLASYATLMMMMKYRVARNSQVQTLRKGHWININVFLGAEVFISYYTVFYYPGVRTCLFGMQLPKYKSIFFSIHFTILAVKQIQAVHDLLAL